MAIRISTRFRLLSHVETQGKHKNICPAVQQALLIDIHVWCSDNAERFQRNSIAA
jgi:hypothetical protein